MVRTKVTSKGQTTVPIEIRRNWKDRDLVWEMAEDGSARVYPVPNVMELYGVAEDPKHPYDPQEKAKARTRMGDG